MRTRTELQNPSAVARNITSLVKKTPIVPYLLLLETWYDGDENTIVQDKSHK